MANIDRLDKRIDRINKTYEYSVDPGFHLFDYSPHIVESYNIQGYLFYSNRNLQPVIDNIEDIITCNILQDPKIKESDIYPFIINAYKGLSSVIEGNENYSHLFNWYDPFTLYEITIFPVFNKNNIVDSIVVIHHEILKKKNNTELHDEEVKKLNNEISLSILSNISHELRTPLNWILGFSELINEEKNVTKIREFNRTIKRGGDLLLSQVENLIEMSAVIKNNYTMEKSRFRVDQLLFELYGLIKNELENLDKDIYVHVMCDLVDDKAFITTDRARLSQILLNLLQNSIKFTKQGQIELGVLIANEHEYLFYVKDTGIGMDKSKQKYIFEVFRKGEEENFNDRFGLGLGLSISSFYVKNLGGQIWVDSELGTGSTFCFTVKDYTEDVISKELINSN